MSRCRAVRGPRRATARLAQARSSAVSSDDPLVYGLCDPARFRGALAWSVPGLALHRTGRWGDCPLARRSLITVPCSSRRRYQYLLRAAG